MLTKEDLGQAVAGQWGADGTTLGPSRAPWGPPPCPRVQAQGTRPLPGGVGRLQQLGAGTAALLPRAGCCESSAGCHPSCHPGKT